MRATMCWCWALCTSLCSCAGSLAPQAYAKDHPFAQLSGSDNVISFSSRRYSQQPLIIRYFEQAWQYDSMNSSLKAGLLTMASCYT